MGPENGLLSLGAPLWPAKVLALQEWSFLCKIDVLLFWRKNARVVFVFGLLDSQQPRGEERGGVSLNKFSIWRAVKILKSGLHLCAVCPPLKSLVLRCCQWTFCLFPWGWEHLKPSPCWILSPDPALHAWGLVKGFLGKQPPHLAKWSSSRSCS